jgi:hypothetical protein
MIFRANVALRLGKRQDFYGERQFCSAFQAVFVAKSFFEMLSIICLSKQKFRRTFLCIAFVPQKPYFYKATLVAPSIATISKTLFTLFL